MRDSLSAANFYEFGQLTENKKKKMHEIQIYKLMYTINKWLDANWFESEK